MHTGLLYAFGYESLPVLIFVSVESLTCHLPLSVPPKPGSRRQSSNHIPDALGRRRRGRSLTGPSSRIHTAPPSLEVSKE